MGIGVGHLYYFAIEVLPDAYGVDVVKTPRALIDACGGGGGAPVTASGGVRGAAPPGRRAPPAPPRGGHNWGGGRVLGER